MCKTCWEEYGAPQIDNVMVRCLADAISSVYEWNGAGGNLHTVLDDWNLDGDMIWETNWINKYAAINDDDREFQDQVHDERRCLALLKQATEEERASALALYDGYWGTMRPVVDVATAVRQANPFLAITTYCYLDDGEYYEVTRRLPDLKAVSSEFVGLDGWLDGHRDFNHEQLMGGW